MQDVDAIRQCRNGNADAFGHLVQRYQRRALADARTLTGNEADAADAAQDAFLDAFRRLGGFDVAREFYPWFYVLLRNRCLKQRARRGTVRERTGDDPRAAAESSRRGARLEGAIERLDRGQSQLVVLKHLDGWTYDELSPGSKSHEERS